MPDPTLARLRERFAEGLSHVPTAMSVVTAQVAGEAFGQTVAGFSPMAGDAPAVMLSVADNRAVLAAIRDSGAFRVSVLTTDQDAIAEELAGGARLVAADPDVWAANAPAGPQLRRSAASFACRLTELRVGGGHVVLFGDPVDVDWRAGVEPLVRLHHGYRRIEDVPLSMFPGFTPARHERITGSR